MLLLDSPRWGELRHAYGVADDIPRLLYSLEDRPEQQAPEAEPWFSLWSALCHQGDAYDASYAAVPHLVRIALEADGPVHFSFLMLPTAIEIARGAGQGPMVLDDLADAYHASIARLPEVVAAQSRYPWSDDFRMIAEAALTVAKGDIEQAEAILDSDGLE